jgi:hypothetical protein
MAFYVVAVGMSTLLASMLTALLRTRLIFIVGGLAAFILVAWRDRFRHAWSSLLTAGLVLGAGYVVAAPAFSAFRLELVFVPMAAFGLAFAVERVADRASDHVGGLQRVGIPVRTRR